MQELVELVRCDHALLHELVKAPGGADDDLLAALSAHREFLDDVVAPLVDDLGDTAATELATAMEDLDRAIDLTSVGEDSTEAVDRHAEQMEQAVLARLMSEASDRSMSDATVEAMARHEELGLGSARPSAMRARPTDRAGAEPRPAGAGPD